MIWISFGRWAGKSTKRFVFERIYRKRWHWTPFVRVRLRRRTWL